jgi:hypothetical protein
VVGAEAPDVRDKTTLMNEDLLHAFAAFAAGQPLKRMPDDTEFDLLSALQASGALFAVRVQWEGHAGRYDHQGVRHTILVGNFLTAETDDFLRSAADLITEAAAVRADESAEVLVVFYGPYLSQFEAEMEGRFPGLIDGIARENTWAATGHVYVVGLRPS